MDKKTAPLSREDAVSFDPIIAKFLLIIELRRIPEFQRLWDPALRGLGQVVEIILSTFFALIADKKTSSDDNEANLWQAKLLEDLIKTSDDVLSGKSQVSVQLPGLDDKKECALIIALANKLADLSKTNPMLMSSRAKLESVLEPLGVPGLLDSLLLIETWKVAQTNITTSTSIFSNGPFNRFLQGELLEGLTELEPTELATETPGRVRQRVKRKIAPLKTHLTKFDLCGRVHIWVQNVVFGKSIKHIAISLEEAPEYYPVGYGSDNWVKKQVKEASKILGVERQSGRPRKGGVLRHWELMVK